MRGVAVSEVDRRRFARARQRGEHAARADRAVVAVHYDEQRDAFELLLRNERTVCIPRTDLPELRGVAATALAETVVSPEGDAISWKALDVDVDVTRFIAAANSGPNDCSA